MPPPPDVATFEARLTDALRRDPERTLVCIGVDPRGLVRDALGRDGIRGLLDHLVRDLEGKAPSGSILSSLDDRRVAIALPLTGDEARRWAERAIDGGTRVLPVRGRAVPLEVGAGLAPATGSATATQLVDDARSALRRAERAGRGRVVLHDAGIVAQADDRLAFEVELRETVKRGGFRLAYQPIVRVPDGTTVATEALLRWTTRWGAPIPPATAIAVAEEIGLAEPLGAWVIDRAVGAARTLGTVHVNLSPGQLNPSLPDIVEEALATHGVPGAQLGFEIAEAHVAASHGDLIRILDRLRDQGCRVGLDDFGAGRSALAQLRWLPLDFVKLDRSLVEAVDHDADARDIAKAVATLCRDLELDLVAEGVERQVQSEALRHDGIVLQQGFFHARPSTDNEDRISCGC